ncbi:MAG: diaminopimelate dehydrogenase [Bacteroidales bacterium]|jgi:diaminopimelate dehydrogenase|nr:diaminopimelate dehydrogenase [Bacteroidales bacterium]
MKKNAAIIGYGNIGKYVLEALQATSDFEVAGVVRRDASNIPHELKNYTIVDDISKLQNVDVAILCAPTRCTEDFAKAILAKGINTVDSYDIHSGIWDLKQQLSPVATANKAVSIISAGWDPGTDSIVRTMMEAMAPKGITYTNFGPGMSMGHSVAAKAICGVKNALSMTIPLGTSIHRRMVYIELENGASPATVEQLLKSDAYFAKDDTHVVFVDDISQFQDMGHGVNMIRKGVSGQTQNQILEFNMRINNPALTAQVLVCAARASFRQQPGSYTMIEIPVVDLLEGDREYWIKKLV